MSRSTGFTPDPLAFALLARMLALAPGERISAKEALGSEYLWSRPFPCTPDHLADSLR